MPLMLPVTKLPRRAPGPESRLACDPAPSEAAAVRRAKIWMLAGLVVTANVARAAGPEPKHPLIVGSELDFPPFALVHDGGVADGFTAELWQAVAREAHLDS